MNLINYGNRNFRSVYHKAIRGAYFGILNAFLIFIPLIYSVWEIPERAILYGIIGAVITLSLLIIVTVFKGKNNYSVPYLKYLLFTGMFNIVFYTGYIYFLSINLNVKLFTLDAYILLLYISLSIMSGADILVCAFRGYGRIKRFYTRTYQKQTFNNIIILSLGLLFGLFLLYLQYMKIS